jgi:hypothetical protein
MHAPVSDPLQDLVRMAGAAAAAELFARFDEDLQITRSGLGRAAASGDLASLRGHSHVLMALAGTAGEAELQDRAHRLNGLARAARPDLTALKALLGEIDSRIAPLIGRVQRIAGELSP